MARAHRVPGVQRHKGARAGAKGARVDASCMRAQGGRVQGLQGV